MKALSFIMSAIALLLYCGSYFFNNKWERIYNIFSYGNIKISGFSPKVSEVWATSNGIPKKFTIHSGNGHSDHLPIMCTLVF